MAAAEGSWDVTGAIPGAGQDGTTEERSRIFNGHSIENNAPQAY